MSYEEESLIEVILTHGRTDSPQTGPLRTRCHLHAIRTAKWDGRFAYPEIVSACEGQVGAALYIAIMK
ncbi:MAG: hypothetical protein ABIZ80_25315 [Bryobacteraceae bacterium]